MIQLIRIGDELYFKCPFCIADIRVHDEDGAIRHLTVDILRWGVISNLQVLNVNERTK